jgi:CDP-diacylglycerol--serine O-phosphatidyltransferase
MAHGITGANIFCGFLSVLMTLNGMGGLAAWLIICAALLDAFDGKVARLMRSDSAFGLHFDSLADMVSFGVAPGALVYWLAFQERGIPGILISSVPPIFAAIRLAKFNIRTEKEAHEYVGLSSPLQGCLLASFVILNLSIWEDVHLEALLAVLVILTGLMMISRFPLPSLPRISLKEPGYNLAKLLALVGCICLVALNPPRYAFPVLMSLVIAAFVTGAIRAARSVNMELDEEEDAESAESEIGIPRGRR